MAAVASDTTSESDRSVLAFTTRLGSIIAEAKAGCSDAALQNSWVGGETGVGIAGRA